MESKHTPGPWSLPSHVCGSDIGITAGDRLVAMVANDEDRPMDDAEQLANARLVAASPELLAALRQCVDRLRGLTVGDVDVWTDEDSDAMEAAVAAIAKAEGRA